MFSGETEAVWLVEEMHVEGKGGREKPKTGG